MKSKPSLSSLAARVLAEDAEPASPVAAGTRRATIAAMTGAMRSRKRRRALTIGVGALLVGMSAAAGVTLLVGARPFAGDAVAVVSTGGSDQPPARTSAAPEHPSAERRLPAPPVTVAASAATVDPLAPLTQAAGADVPGARAERLPSAPPIGGVASGVSVAKGSSGSVDRVPVPVSDLARQNDLFDRAMARKQAGDPNGSVAALDELLGKFPGTHLGQSARAERMKLLRGIDDSAARAAALDYLQRYPKGFARSDAVLIAGRP